MAFTEVLDLDVDTAVTLGGYNKKAKKDNPTTVQGHLVGTRRVPSKFSKDEDGMANFYVFTNASIDGVKAQGTVGVFGGKRNLDDKMAIAEPGQLVRASFVGTKPTTMGQDKLLFKVGIDRDNTIDVANFAGGAATDTEDASNEYTGTNYVDSDDSEETSLDSDEAAPDEIPPQRAQAPRQAAKAPSAERQAQVNALLNKSRTARTA